jgi:hypothetical protein
MIAFIFGCIISICRKIYIHIKSPLRNATIIGYRYTKKPFWTTIYMPTRFWPVIAYDDPQYGANIAVKSLKILIPENHKIQLRMHKDRFFQFYILGEILSLSFLTYILLKWFFPDTAEALVPFWNIIFFSISGVFLVHIVLHFMLTKKQLGTKQTLQGFVESERPENYEDYTKQDFIRIENAELMTYQGAMAHYYKENKYWRAEWLQLSLMGLCLVWGLYYWPGR